MAHSIFDTIIIGAGVAGLACASRLRGAGARIVVLEARDRIGGRILTERAPDLDAPIELGAEFVHGDAEPLRDVASQFHLPRVDMTGTRFAYAHGRLRPDRDFWPRLDRVARPLNANGTNDRSFADALAANHRSLSPADRAFATQYVEGYHAADTNLISEQALADGGFPEGDEHEQRIGRVLTGYGPMTERLGGAVRPQIRLGCVASRIAWKDGRVDVTFLDSSKHKAQTISGQTVVVTVPLGVLAAPADAPGAIAIDPPVASHARAVELMAMGTVVKLVLHFDHAFWREEKLAERLGVKRLDQMSFIQSSGKLEFPVWWSMYPIDAPLLIAWRGGPVATEMSRLPIREQERRAIASLAEIFAIKPASLRRRLVATFNHDWINDPFSRGVYSYSRVGGANACVMLSRPVHDTIWFAGEAADRLGRTGTVHGAIGSGWRAADEILRR